MKTTKGLVNELVGLCVDNGKIELHISYGVIRICFVYALPDGSHLYDKRFSLDDVRASQQLQAAIEKVKKI